MGGSVAGYPAAVSEATVSKRLTAGDRQQAADSGRPTADGGQQATEGRRYTVTDEAPDQRRGDRPGRDHRAVRQFIERFAATLTEAGVPRMPARVFVALLATDSGRMTAPQVAERLQVSPAAVSGAVRYLAQVDLIVRERDPGSRRDHYVVRDNTWYEATLHKGRQLTRWEALVREGLEALGPGTPAGARLAETLVFFDFLDAEMDQMLERWKERQAGLRASSGDVAVEATWSAI